MGVSNLLAESLCRVNLKSVLYSWSTVSCEGVERGSVGGEGVKSGWRGGGIISKDTYHNTK